MSALRSVKEGFRKVWGMGEEDDYEDEESESTSRRTRYQVVSNDLSQPHEIEIEERSAEPQRAASQAPSRNYAPANAARAGRQSSPDDEEEEEMSRFQSSREPAPRQSAPSDNRGGSGGLGGAHNLRSVAMPLRARDKNIYTLKPKTMDEASLAADYLKTGCAVVVNLEEVERMVAVRIIDFMSGVCYGLENQGHAMKLGDVIFLFTPGDFEITSDEIDYAENRDIIFKDVSQKESDDAKAAQPTSENAGERRSWER